MSAAQTYLTTRQFAARVGRTPQYIRVLLQRGEICGAVRGRGRWGIPESAVALFVRGIRPEPVETAPDPSERLSRLRLRWEGTL